MSIERNHTLGPFNLLQFRRLSSPIGLSPLTHLQISCDGLGNKCAAPVSRLWKRKANTALASLFMEWIDY